MELSIENISKRYGKKTALKDINLKLSNGIYGLLGPNGAGKTTLISIIVGLLNADNGQILCNGINICDMGTKYREKIGFLPQYPQFYANYNARDFLKYMCCIKGIPKSKRAELTDNVLELVNLSDTGNKKIGGFSGGMKQRLGIAQAILNDPELLILDEPTAGLDPKERIRFRNIISELSADRIVILATHIVSDISYIANEVILLGNGQLIEKEKSASLIENMRGKVWSVNVPAKSVTGIMEKYSVSNVKMKQEMCELKIVSDNISGIQYEHSVADPDLEDVYLYYFDKR